MRNSGRASIRRPPSNDRPQGTGGAKYSAHSRESGNPAPSQSWTPAFAGVSGEWCALLPASLTPALFLKRAAPPLNRLENAVGRHRQVVEADADRIGDGVGERGQERRERAFTRFLGAERAVRIVALDDPNLDRR